MCTSSPTDLAKLPINSNRNSTDGHNLLTNEINPDSVSSTWKFFSFFVLAFGFERWIAMASTGPVSTVRILVLLLQGKVATI